MPRSLPRSLTKLLLPAGLRKRLKERRKLDFDRYATKSYSQEGEDLILRRLFEKQHTGFYVDVGAHHPMRFSNTYHFYCNGWRGINIDAMPNSMESFNSLRDRDINIETPISDQQTSLTYYMFNEPALNSFDKELSENRNDHDDDYRIVETIELKTRTLSWVLDEHLPADTRIDFLSVDVEGLDLCVLKSNDWTRYRPDVVLVELLGSSIATMEKNEAHQFLRDKGYSLFAKSVYTAFFTRDGFAWS